MKTPLLVLCPVNADNLDVLAERYDLVYAPTAAERGDAIAAHGARIQAVLTIGTIGLTATEMAAMPALQLVSCHGAGYENVDVDAAKARGIVVTNGRGANDECVADHAMGLLIACMRDFRKLDQLCRAGVWRTKIALPPNVSGKRLGILGMGTIGEKIATRARAFRMDIGYHNRNAKPGSPHGYFENVLALAEWCDVLVCAAPGGASTHHLVDAAVLKALGPEGFLVNVGRGSIVDTQALAEALRAGTLGGAGIDVYESEPDAPAELIDLDRLILTPHLAGWSPEAIAAQFSIFLDNVDGHFSGRGAVTPV
ncbi:2-hydroxyacid dehydrogenase [Bordetella genomosp. 5]|uniref:Hydroxyacid dehydrogenase n=1 Tax=Bordetella genomosp. 5 TaxID=1395608 RepID=A0A261TGX6_9BORD|nr:2-hydroxyacid dehydrogenase [Bordetella genomosp. 5]OZI48918.1 hydroxyacid dehydrogenase [Bordetella genomosp. 5]